MSALGDVVSGGISYIGNRKAKRAQEAAVAQARADLNAGYDQYGRSLDTGESALTQGYDTGSARRQSTAGQMGQVAQQGLQAQSDLWAPWMAPGLDAYKNFDRLLNDPTAFNDVLQTYSKSPQFQFQMQQATDAIKRSAAATGNRLGGAQLSALQGRAEDVANQGFNSWLDRLQQMAQTGFAATGNMANAQNQFNQAQTGALQYGDTSNWDIAKGKDILDINRQRGDLALQKAQDLAGLSGASGQINKDYALSQSALGSKVAGSVIGGMENAFMPGGGAAGGVANMFKTFALG